MSEDEYDDYDPSTWEEPAGQVTTAFAPSVSVTFKGDGSFPSPWVVYKGPDLGAISKDIWKASAPDGAAREAFNNGDVFTGIAAAAAEFAGKVKAVGLTQAPAQDQQTSAPAQQGAPAQTGYTNAQGAPAGGSNIQQAGQYIPQWAVGLQIPIGDVSGLPMKPKEGNGAKGYWAMWTDPRPWAQIKDLPPHLRDKPVNPPKK